MHPARQRSRASILALVERARRGRAFTLVEMIVVIVLLAILAVICFSTYVNYASNARESADRGSLGAIRTALNYSFTQHRTANASSSAWVNTVGDIATVFEPPRLPFGITVVGAQLKDQRGNFYDFLPETDQFPARVTLAAGSEGP